MEEPYADNAPKREKGYLTKGGESSQGVIHKGYKGEEEKQRSNSKVRTSYPGAVEEEIGIGDRKGENEDANSAN